MRVAPGEREDDNKAANRKLFTYSQPDQGIYKLIQKVN